MNLSGMYTLTNLFCHFTIKGWQIFGCAAGYQSFIYNYLFIYPIGAGINQVNTDSFYGGHAAAFHHTGVDQYLRTVANGSYGFTLSEKGLYKSHSLIVYP